MNYVQYREDFSLVFSGTLRELVEGARQVVPEPTILDTLLQATLEVGVAGGKRIRPYLANLAARSAGSQVATQNLEECLELIHLFALIHDDIMDRSDVRHGSPTIHARVRDELGSDHANWQAMLMGDLVYTWAWQRLTSDSNLQPALAEVSRLLQEVVLGQALDLDASLHAVLSPSQFATKTLLKTARYSVVGPMRAGFAVAHRPDLFSFAEDFGMAVGYAFQLQDDYLDLFQENEVLGKPGGLDVAHHQHTSVTQAVHACGADEQWRRALQDGTLERLRAVVRECGAEQHVLNEIADGYARARTIIPEGLPFAGEWHDLVSMLEARGA